MKSVSTDYFCIFEVKLSLQNFFIRLSSLNNSVLHLLNSLIVIEVHKFPGVVSGN